jgi:hypothetical protein
MYSQFEQSTNLVETVFDILNEMDFDTVKDKELLEELHGYCAKIDNDRCKLLSFIQNMIDEYGLERRHPLISTLYEIFQKEYQVQFESPIKLKMKEQIDSLSENSTAKDEFIHLMLHQFREQGINAYLIAPEKNEPQISGSCFFSVISQKKLIPILQNIVTEIHNCILYDETTHPRIQMIIRLQEHYCVLDFDKLSKQCLVLDAAGDAQQTHILDVLQSSSVITSVVYVNNFTYEYHGVTKTTTLQKDYYSCSVFALDHIQVCAHQENLHELLRQRGRVESEKLKSISWFDLPVSFIRNAQSPTFKDKYCATTGDESAKEYLELYNFKRTVKYLKLHGVRLLIDIPEEDCQEMIDCHVSPRV